MLQNSTFRKLARERGEKMSKCGDFNRTVRTTGQHPAVKQAFVTGEGTARKNTFTC